jgi:hypothetical protein
MADEEKSPVDQLIDAFVYAPIGIALSLRESLPTFVQKGRQRFESETTTARIMGQYAVRQTAKDNRKRFERFIETLVSLGVIPGNAPEATPPAQPATRVEPTSTSTNGHATAPSDAVPAPGTDTAAANGAPRPDGSDLAIPGYDTLSASQVVQRLAGLSDDELEAVRAYEEATRGRRTILSKVAQLQTS